MNFAALPQRISHARSPIWATVQGTTEFPRSPKIGSHSLRAEINFDGTKPRIEAERTNTTIRSMSYFSRLISRTQDRTPGVAPRVDPLLEFDFQLHADPSEVTGPHWFELAPGPYERKHWQPGSRFISEFTFCLIEGIFERHAPAFDHFSYAEVPGSQWKIILADLAILRAALVEAGETAKVALPYGYTLRVQPDFEQNWAANQRQLASLLSSLDQWLRETLALNDSISVLGL